MNRAATPTVDAGRRPLRRVLAVLLVAVLAAGAVLWIRSLHWPIEVIRIEGETRFSDTERLRRIVSAHVRHGFFGTDLPALRAELVAMPWVREVALRRIWPDRLDVEIREHEAAARWNDDALVSDRGVVYRPESIAEQGLVRLSGPQGQATDMLAALARFELRLAAVDLEVVAIDQDARRSWTVTLAGDLRVRLGRDRIGHRLDRLVAAWPMVIAGQHARVDTVDLRYPNGFAIAWREPAEGTAGGGA